jgi:opacity protein-like surface antigen
MKHKKYHLIYFISLFFILSLVSTTTAQTSYLDSLDGKFALQFQIGSDFRLFAFQGSTFSGKYHIGRKEVLRLGISLGFADGSGERDQTFFNNDSTTQSDIESNDLTIDVRIQYNRYLVSTNDLGFYGGIGPFVRYTKFEESADKTPPVDYPIEQSGKDFSVGLSLLIGIEWMFIDNMSLSAEYGLLLYYNTYDEVYTYTYAYDPVRIGSSSDSFKINSDQVKFGISVYF